ncbi:MAG: GMC oxidoreductase [Vulcanococcus sp.]
MADAIVVGSGATGGVAAMALAEAGLQVLVLEAGPELTAQRAFGSEPLNSLRRVAQISSGRKRIAANHPGFWKANPDLFVDEQQNPYSTPPERPFLWTRGRQVGGKSLTWGGITLRLSDHEFQAAERDGHGRNWPIRHADLAPYYEQLERLLRVHGQRDGLAQLPDGAFEPPLPLTPAEQHLRQCIRRDLDLPLIHSRGFALPRAADGPWPRSSSQGGALAVALASGRVRLQSQAVVSHVEVDPRTGRAKGVVVVDGRSGERRREQASLVVLCASTIESVRLLLHSCAAGGLEDVSGRLGLGLMDHISTSRFFRIPDQPPAAASELSGAGSCFIPNTVNLGGAAPSDGTVDFRRGYGLWCGIQRFDPPQLLKRQRNAAVGFLIGHGEVLSDDGNRVSLDDERRDAWGLPVARIDCRWGENEARMVAHMQARMQAVVASAGGEIAPLHDLFVMPLLEPLVRNSLALAPGAPPPGYYIHELGGAAMASSDQEGVLNRWNQVWRTPNLLVTDGSCWPSAGWQSPTLTEMAVTWRACSHAAAALRRHAL